MARTARVDGHTLVQRSVNPIPIAYRTIRRMKSRCPRPSRATITPTATAGGPRICVVGGGVIGLTTALRVYETLPTASVTIAAEKIATDTTSEGAAGLWKPYAISGTDPALYVASRPSPGRPLFLA